MRKNKKNVESRDTDRMRIEEEEITQRRWDAMGGLIKMNGSQAQDMMQTQKRAEVL